MEITLVLQPKHVDLIGKVQDAIDAVKHGRPDDTQFEWEYLSAMCTKLSRLENPSGLQKKLLEMIEPILDRYMGEYPELDVIREYRGRTKPDTSASDEYGESHSVNVTDSFA